MFRPTVLVERVERVECQREKESLKAFLAFLKQFGPKILLVGFDEDTMAVLRKKLKKVDNGKTLYLYTWWKKILEYKRFDTSFQNETLLFLESAYLETRVNIFSKEPGSRVGDIF